MSKKIHAKRIYITRAEGFHHECDVTHVCDSFAEANVVLRWMARTAPEGGGYDKCDFYVIFQDGETYEGRYDLTWDDVFEGDLAKHMRDHCEFSAGVRIPAHLVAKYGEAMARKRYQSFLDEIVTAKGVEHYKAFLAKYSLDASA